MKISKHAASRCCQRGISEQCVDIIMRYGRVAAYRRDAYRYTIPREERDALVKKLRQVIVELEKASGPVVITSEDGTAITVHRNLRGSRKADRAMA